VAHDAVNALMEQATAPVPAAPSVLSSLENIHDELTDRQARMAEALDLLARLREVMKYLGVK
jgi:hypothetical protein